MDTVSALITSCAGRIHLFQQLMELEWEIARLLYEFRSGRLHRDEAVWRSYSHQLGGIRDWGAICEHLGISDKSAQRWQRTWELAVVNAGMDPAKLRRVPIGEISSLLFRGAAPSPSKARRLVEKRIERLVSGDPPIIPSAVQSAYRSRYEKRLAEARQRVLKRS